MEKKQHNVTILAVMNQKGGVGKSTTVVNLSAALSRRGRRVLVVDFDPQGNATSGLGIAKDSLETDMYEVLLHNVPVKEGLIHLKNPELDVLPATVQLAGAEVQLVDMDERELMLKRVLEPLSEGYDFVLIDCPPSLGLLTVNALCAADAVLIPIQCEYYALEGVAKLLETIQMVSRTHNPSLYVFGIVMTMYDGRTTLSKQVVEEVRRYFGERVFSTLIPRTVKLAEAPGFGQAISSYAPISKGAFAYAALAKEVIDRG